MSPVRSRVGRLAVSLGFTIVGLVPALAAQEPYKEPPAPIAQILDAPPIPAVSVSPTREWLLILERRALPSIAEIAGPELRLAGERISPRTNGRTRESTLSGLRLRSTAGTVERRIVTPPGARISDVMWSSDGVRVAFTITSDSGIALWVADVATGESRRLTAPVLNGTTGAPCAWRGGSAGFVCLLVVSDRGAPPPPPEVPVGPIIQESRGRAAPARTYEDLLASPHDEALFDYYFTSQVALVDLDGRITPIGRPGIHTAADPSPDGRYLYVETVHRPYSYLVPLGRFPVRMEVWDSTGTVVKALADRPLQESIPIAFDAVPTGPRSISWRADAPATLVWVEALDQGNPSAAASMRDRVRMLEAPFTGEPATLIELATRVRGLEWARANLAFVTEYWWRTRQTRTWIVDPSRPGTGARVLFDRSAEDRYGDPGRFVMARGPFGAPVVLTTADGRHAYLDGQGASPEGDRPFFDRIDLTTGKTQRLWRSAAPYYEELIAPLDAQGRRIITRRESVTEVPNYFVRDLRAKTLTKLTSFADPAPQFAGVTSQLIRYKRADGVELSATLYLPAGYDTSQGPLPFFFWAYPREFKSAAAAAQTVGSPYRFTRPTGPSHLFLLTQGYGVLDGPTMPIIGEGNKEPNDTYVEQLVASAQAAVDKVVSMGVADRNRIGIGGHSYGAFMTANLLAHSRLFRAGIARSGAYNRTLTPFGFQQEERTYWKARDVYTRMSPFTYADSIEAPILLIHGMADDNSGTFPIQSERFYAALKGNGATVRYVQLPAEAHGYRARESVGHTLWEMVRWLDLYVKQAPGAKAAQGNERRP
jgi:dipeptidyl aminopeptidase/acylaminoacyl peptidase